MSIVVQFKTIEYNEQNNEVIILDQTKLPGEEKYIKLKTIEDMYNAIKNMHLRGAPLIGVAAAYGVVLAAYSGKPADVIEAGNYIKSARPTAVNLGWAIKRMKDKVGDGENLYEILL
jgi:methylthioribose-1-phosphate isomerase